MGDSEKAIRDVFMKARLNAPCIIFIDEIDSIASSRGNNSTDVSDRVLIQLLTEMDGFSDISDVIVIGATNRPEILDSAIIRPGRLDELVYISLPDRDARLDILKIGTKRMVLSKEIDMNSICDRMDGYTGAEIIQMCSVAGYNSIKRTLDDDTIILDDFMSALDEVKSRISAKQLKVYESFSQNV